MVKKYFLFKNRWFLMVVNHQKTTQKPRFLGQVVFRWFLKTTFFRSGGFWWFWKKNQVVFGGFGGFEFFYISVFITFQTSNFDIVFNVLCIIVMLVHSPVSQTQSMTLTSLLASFLVTNKPQLANRAWLK